MCVTPGPPVNGFSWCGQSAPTVIACNCPPGQSCQSICSGDLCTVDWYCQPTATCPPGFTLCATGCSNLSTDKANCGACGNSCGSGICCGGNCCSSGMKCCGGACTNVSSDPANCGSCGATCSQCCYNGSCGVNSVCASTGPGCCPSSAPICSTPCPDGTTLCCPSFLGSAPGCINLPLVGNVCT